MPQDIRELTGDPEAYAAELRRRWGGLLSYIGPFRVECEPIPGAGDTVAVRVVLHDEGADDKPITAGSYLFTVRGRQSRSAPVRRGSRHA